MKILESQQKVDNGWTAIDELTVRPESCITADSLY